MAASASGVWLSIEILKEISTPVRKTITKANFGETVGDFVSKHVKDDELVIRTDGYTSECKSEMPMDLPSDTPISVVEKFRIQFVKVKICKGKDPAADVDQSNGAAPSRSAFDVLMGARKKYSYLPPERLLLTPPAKRRGYCFALRPFVR
jgi:hypothetical protein